MNRLQALNVPIRPWVPRWLGLLTAFVILLPITLVNGAYTGDIVEVSGTLGVMSEDIRMAYYATSVGMAIAYPIIPKLRPVITTKTVLLIDLLLQVILSFICANARQMEIVITCSFFIGILKAFVMLEFTTMTRPFFSPKNVRSEFYAYFYPLVFSGGQISMALTAQLAYSYQWQYMYYFVMILQLLAILFVLLFFRYARRPIRFPFREIDWKSMLVGSTAMLQVVYVATYGKQLDWFSSDKILAYTLAAPLLLWLFVRRQYSQTPFIRLTVLNSSKALIGYVFMIITMVLSSSSSVLTSYLNSVLRIDSVHANSLNLWMLPGFVCGAFICYWWFRWQRWRFRILIAGGMSCFAVYLAILYFGIEPDGTYEMLYLPMFFRGMRMLILFIAFGVYVVEDLDPKLLIYNAFFLITFRSVLAPSIASAFFNNMIYRLQLQSMSVLSENMRMDNPLAAGTFNQSLNNALAQGHPLEEATQLATNTLYNTLQTQGLLLGLKTLLGYTLLFAIVMAIVSRFIPFHKTLKVEIVRTGEDMV